ncbi:hypothetical protein MTR_0212s0070 [Medicago truncatula]|uniref:Uncharacterized protein n=1 Tax=Medicago truncatula TaxID=3880 RepID=A0A072TGB2_MEDTR|nr:hypothetical protein MTR_0212s0070 [Medicago truncatula]
MDSGLSTFSVPQSATKRVAWSTSAKGGKSGLSNLSLAFSVGELGVGGASDELLRDLKAEILRFMEHLQNIDAPAIPHHVQLLGSQLFIASTASSSIRSAADDIAAPSPTTGARTKDGTCFPKSISPGVHSNSLIIESGSEGDSPKA